ncbi:MAG: PIG-L family deacetylase [Candidatus Marinimicrobia bacterium]|nr:PIG-L family deacetylase [Candidatus Neomarinimicrobiota bacterium]
MKSRIMIISPHPDDAELGMGGSIIKFIDQGHEVIVVDMTSGEPTPCGTPKKGRRRQWKLQRFSV